MGSRYDENPFADKDEDVNPFSNPAVRAQTSNLPAYNGTQYEPYSLHPLPSSKDVNIDGPLGGGKDLKKKEKELNAKEEHLRKWEKELQKREEALNKAGVHLETPNFPPFFPIFHHDIARDIPDHLRYTARVALVAWIGLLVTLLWNIIALTAAWVITVQGNVVNETRFVGAWFLLTICVVAGWFGSYFGWYRPLYRALRRESAGRFLWFFVFFLLHIGFCIYAAIAPSVYLKINAFTGILSTLMFSDAGYPRAALFYGIGCVMYLLELLVSFHLVHLVSSYFRGIGKAAEMKRTAAIRAAMG